MSSWRDLRNCGVDGESKRNKRTNFDGEGINGNFEFEFQKSVKVSSEIFWSFKSKSEIKFNMHWIIQFHIGKLSILGLK